MKVLHLIDSGGLYGAERMLLDLVECQRRAGVEATILSATNNTVTTKPLVKAARDRHLDIIEWPMADGLNLPQANRILKFAHQQGVTVLHSHGYKFNILMGLLPRWWRRLPLVSTVHGYLAAARGTKLWLYQQLDRRLLATMDATIFVSKAMLQQPAFRQLRIRNRQVIYNGIDVEAMQRGLETDTSVDIMQQYFPADCRDGSGTVQLILSIGRLTAEKGYTDLVDAFATITEKWPRARLLIAGEGPERPALERQLASLGLVAKVAMPGFVSPTGPLLRCADLLVMSSYTEGMPMTLLEAVVAGLPIVATNVGGIPEVLQGYGRSQLVAAGQPEALAGAMAASLDHPGGVEMDIQAFARIFSSERMERSYSEVYNTVAGIKK